MIHLIIKHGFDSMENRIGSAQYTKIIAYAETEIDAREFISNQKQRTYKGWDGVEYPYYTVEPVLHADEAMEVVIEARKTMQNIIDKHNK